VVDKGMGFYNHVIQTGDLHAVHSVVVLRNFCFVAKVVIIHTYQDDVIIFFFFKEKKLKKKVAIIPKKI
jgi:hypothetical protein